MAQPASHMWYVRAAERVWGPYPQARMEAFVREGRVTLASPVSPFAGGPFTPAAGHGEFAALLLEEAERQELFAAPVLAGEPEDAPASQPRPQPAPLRPEVSVSAMPAPRPATPAPAPAQAAPAAAPLAASGPVRTLLVWGELAEGTLRTFPAALAAFGPHAAIRPGLWLVQARLGASALRNLLSRRLGAADSLLVVEAPLEQAAWFNLEPGRDRELRQLWGVRA